MFEQTTVMTPEEIAKRREAKEAEFRKMITRRESYILELLENAESRYGVTFPKNFAKKLAREARDKTWLPERNIIDVIEREWQIWKPYLDEDSKPWFFQEELKSIFAIKCTATNSSPKFNAFIGNKATVTSKLPTMSTCISDTGVLWQDGHKVRATRKRVSLI